MAENKKDEGKTSEVKATKAELKTQDHVLIRNVTIGDKDFAKGTSYPLTEKGRKYFKSLNYIK